MVYSSLIILYLFLGGASAGAALVVSLWSLLIFASNKTYSDRYYNVFISLRKSAYLVAFLGLTISALCLLFDLKNPEHILYLFTRPRPTPITFGTFALTIELIVVACLVLALWVKPLGFSGRIRKILEILCVPTSCAVMGYTGVYLAVNVAVPFWNTPWIVPLFFFSSLSSGVAAVLLIVSFMRRSELLHTSMLQKVHLVCLTLEVISAAVFLGVGFTNPAASQSLAILFGSSALEVGTLGFLGLGIAVPAVSSILSLVRLDGRPVPFSDVACLIGGLSLRACIIMCAIH